MGRKTATKLDVTVPGAKGDAALYKLSEPLAGYDLVVVSSVNAMYSGDETYIFPGNPDGTVLSWGELEGSQQGIYNHEIALGNAGYSVTI